MLDSLSEVLGGIPIPGVVAILCLGLVQLCLQVVAVVDWIRRGQALAHRGLWLLLIVCGSLVGALLYLVLARRNPDPPSPASSPSSSSTAGKVDAALDLLYGEKEGE